MSRDPSNHLHGAPTWLHLIQRDPDAGQAFYRDLFGWTCGSPQRRDGGTLSYLSAYGEIFGSTSTAGDVPGWLTYFDVDDLQAALGHAISTGATILIPTHRMTGRGRWAVLKDPEGAVFGLWQAHMASSLHLGRRPGEWSFSVLHASVRSAAIDWYVDLFGWGTITEEVATAFTAEGIGQRLARAGAPTISERLDISDELADAVAWAVPLQGHHRWTPTFAVEDRDLAVERALSLGATVTHTIDQYYTRNAVIVDPQGAVFAVSQRDPYDAAGLHPDTDRATGTAPPAAMVTP